MTEKMPEIGVRLAYERTFNLGNFNSQKFALEITGDIKEIQKYDNVEVLLKSIIKKMNLTVETVKKNISDTKEYNE